MEVLDTNASVLKTPISRFKQKQSTGCQSPSLSMPASPFLERLGYGTGVIVYLVERSPRHGVPRSPWAVKKISKTQENPEIYSKRMKEEAKILKSLSHKNIVEFKALTNAKDGMLCLALEDADRSLFSIIEDRMDNGLGALLSSNIMKVASDIADALAYLHNDKKLLHGDIKSGNVLIKGDFAIAKLCDFGVTVKLDENLTALSSLYVGTESWSAKEALGFTADGYVSDKSDIYSYGLVIYEMLTLSIPHFDIFPGEEDFETEEEFQKVFEDAERNYSECLGTRPLLPHSTFGRSYEDPISLFYVCTDEDSNTRPSARQVITSLRSRTKLDDVQCRLDFEGKS